MSEYKRLPQIAEEAMEKMLNEMSKGHNSMTDEIHNWLCQQAYDEILMAAILKPAKTIHFALQYLMKIAAEKAKKEGSWSGIDNTPIYDIIREYFMNDEIKNEAGPKAQASMGQNKSSTSNPIEHTPDEDAERKNKIDKINEKNAADKNALKMAKEKEKSDQSGLMSMFDFGIEMEEKNSKNDDNGTSEEEHVSNDDEEIDDDQECSEDSD